MRRLERHRFGIRAQLLRHGLLHRVRQRHVLERVNVGAGDAIRPGLVGSRGGKQRDRSIGHFLGPLGLLFGRKVAKGDLGEHVGVAAYSVGLDEKKNVSGK